MLTRSRSSRRTSRHTLSELKMKLLRVALCCICFTLPAQSPDSGDVQRAHDAGDRFALAWNAWAASHSKYTISLADKERFQKVRKAWKEFDRLYKDIE